MIRTEVWLYNDWSERSPENMSPKQRPHCLFFSSFSSCLADWMSTFTASWKICCGVFRQADGIKEFLLQSDSHKYSLMTHSWASLMANITLVSKTWKKIEASLAHHTKILGRKRLWHSSPLPMSVCSLHDQNTFSLFFLYLFTLCDYWYICVCIPTLKITTDYKEK